MNALLTRIFAHWKTTAGALLAMASIVVGAFTQTGSTQKGFIIAGIVITGFTGLLAKDS